MRTSANNAERLSRLALAAALLITIAAPGAAQRRQDGSGDYYVQVRNDAGQLVEMRVVPMNKVNVSIRPVVMAEAGGGFRYEYHVMVLPTSEQPLAFFELDCTSDQAAGLSVSATRAAGSARWTADFYDAPGRPSCSFETGADFLAANDVLAAGMRSNLLPVIGDARAFGFPDAPVVWPTRDPLPENEAARQLVDEVSGLRGGWKNVQTIVPGRDPSIVNDPRSALSALRSDLKQACSAGWITPRRVCTSLEVRLAVAAASLNRGNIQPARSLLLAFRRSLEAQRSRQLNDNAYALLVPLTDLLVAALTPPPTTEEPPPPEEPKDERSRTRPRQVVQ